MRYRKSICLAIVVVMVIFGSAAAALAGEPSALDKAFDGLKTFDWGHDRNLLKPIDDAVVATHGDKAARRELELRLAAVLKTGAPRDAKDFVCRKLMIIGTAESVPALAALLPDKELSHMARFALERIPAPEAAQALRDALPKLDGSLKLGVVASLGARRDAKSVPALIALTKEKEIDTPVSRAAIRALGDIGTREAADAVRESLAAVHESTSNQNLARTAVDALLACGERLYREGNKDAAANIYNWLLMNGWHKPVRLAMIRGTTRGQAKSDVGWFPESVFLVDGDRHGLGPAGIEWMSQRAKGAKANERIRAALPKLPVEIQLELVSALVDRGDSAARGAMLMILDAAQDLRVRVACIDALGPLGEPADVPTLISLLAPDGGGRWLPAPTEAQKAAARTALSELRGKAVAKAIVAHWKSATPEVRAELIGILVARRALDRVPDILAAATDPDARVRMAAMAALGELARPEQVADMLPGVLKAEPGGEREAAEKAVMFVCNRSENPDQRVKPLLAAWAKMDENDKTALLPLLGRVGTAKALEVVEGALADQTPGRREAGLRALCNWPDASAAAELMDLAQSDAEAGHRLSALRAAIRVAALPDKRPDAERLDLLKKCMTMATRNDERNLVLQRARTVRTVESLRFVAAYLDQPENAQEACATVVELAHHRELREPNKAEFDKALDAVIRTAKDAGVVDRAKRYKKGQT